MHTDQCYRPQIVKESKQVASNINISQDELKFLEDNDQETILCQNLPGADGFTFRTPGKPRIRRTGDLPVVDFRPGQTIYGIGNYPKVPNPRIAATQKNDPNDQCPKENKIYILPDFGPVQPDGDSIVPVESIMGNYSSLRKQYQKLQKSDNYNKQASSLIRKLTNGALTPQSKDVKRIEGIRKSKIYEARSKNVRVYFRMEEKTVKIIAPCLKKDQGKDISQLKKYFQ